MADKASKPKDPAPAENAEAAPVEAGPKKPSGLFTIIKAVGFVLVIVIVEVVAASMFIPSAQDTERLARQYVAAGEGEDAPLEDEESKGHDEDEEHGEEVEEVELGTFNVTHFNPATNSTLSIDFELFGAVLAENHAEFSELFEKNKIRIREQVILTLHGADAKDLSDAGLGLLKRQILEKTNRALGQPLVREVLFSKFNFIER
jgi:flagellar basal body-associated protein FliL